MKNKRLASNKRTPQTQLMQIRTAFTIAFCFSVFLLKSQSPDWDWAISAGGNNIDKGNAITTDPTGNVIVTGGFSSTTLTIGSTTLTNAGTVDLFVAKYDPSGNAVWAVSFGNIASEEGTGIATDASGNIYVTGYFESPSLLFGTTNLINADGTNYTGDLFLAKLDPSGTVLWAKKTGNDDHDRSLSVATDSQDDIYICGFFRSDTIDFGTGLIINNGIAIGSSDLFIAKYDPQGNNVWSQSNGGIGGEEATAITVDINDNIYLTGTFGTDSIVFGTTTLMNPAASGSNYGELFLTRYNTSGNIIWAQRAGGTFSESGKGIATDLNGNIFVTGRFYSTTFIAGPSTLTNEDATGTYYDILLVKFNSSGVIQWAKGEGGSDFDEGLAITTDMSGNCVLTGYFYSLTANFESNTLTNSGTASTANIFVAKYDSSGNLIWTYTPAGDGHDEGHGITTGPQDVIYCTGLFRSSNTQFLTAPLSHAGFGDVFIAKLLPPNVSTDNLQSEKFSLYPNPSAGEFTIELSKVPERIELINLLGEIAILSSLHQEHKVNIYLEKSGVYFIRVYYSDQTQSCEVMIIE